jgi:glutamine synthetase
VIVEANRITETAKRVIAGYLRMAPSLTAFGNTVPTSYLRLSPNQEAPTEVFWGDQNRAALVRIPLGWVGANDMVKHANPLETEELPDFSQSQTIEFRCPDGSANVHLLLAGLAVAARHGMDMPDALELADGLYVAPRAAAPQDKGRVEQPPRLPRSCWESAEALIEDRAVYEQDGVFTPVLIDGFAEQLRKFGDSDLLRQSKLRDSEVKKLVESYLYCG